MEKKKHIDGLISNFCWALQCVIKSYLAALINVHNQSKYKQHFKQQTAPVLATAYLPQLPGAHKLFLNTLAETYCGWKSSHMFPQSCFPGNTCHYLHINKEILQQNILGEYFIDISRSHLHVQLFLCY